MPQLGGIAGGAWARWAPRVCTLVSVALPLEHMLPAVFLSASGP
jgi:hypothetical protein